MQHQPTGAAFDVVLLLHVGCVVAGLATTAAAAATARRLRRLLLAGTPIPEALRRYFQPGVNWAGRSVYGIPVFGFALLAMSRGVYSMGEGWVLAGLVLFGALALVCEGVLWPAERRVQAGLQRPSQAGAAGAGNAEAVSVPRDAALMARTGIVALVLLVAGTVVMVSQP